MSESAKPGIPDPRMYLAEISQALQAAWPNNRTINIVAHGHSVPAGYFATPVVQPFDAYPHLLHRAIREVYPLAVVNVIVTAIGGEHSEQGAARFDEQVLCHQPDVLLIDYGLNDRSIGLHKAAAAWESMIRKAQQRNIKTILLTPTGDIRGFGDDPPGEGWTRLRDHAEQIRALAARHGVGLADSFAAFERHVRLGGSMTDLLSSMNHPSRAGHQIVANELMRWFFRYR